MMHARRRLLLATTRPAVRAYFQTLAESTWFPWSVSHLEVDGPMHTDNHLVGRSNGASSATDVLATADVAVIDALPDPPQAVVISEQLRRHRPDVPIVAVVCCSRSVTAANLDALLAAGASGVLDLDCSAHEVYRTLRAAEEGGISLHLTVRGKFSNVLGSANHVRGEAANGLRRVLLNPHDIRLLELQAHGSTDREIGAQVHLSANTVHHEVQRLYHKLGRRNRTELAAWAGHQGYYEPLRLS